MHKAGLMPETRILGEVRTTTWLGASGGWWTPWV